MSSVCESQNTDSLACKLVILLCDPVHELGSHGMLAILVRIICASAENDIGSTLGKADKLTFLDTGVICGHHLTIRVERQFLNSLEAIHHLFPDHTALGS